ncbi:MAG: PEGA domain-containing protein [Candidatus Gottesmanbacteria bacterium]
MKQKIFFLIGTLLFVAIIIAVVKMVSGKSSKQGDLRVESNPVASVFLDNKHIGRTPIGENSYKVDPGEYTLKIVPESGTTQFASWQGKITIGPNLLTYVKADISESELSTAVDVLWLERISGKKAEVSVTTMPDSATVMLDDETKGMTPIIIPDVATGNHTITVTSQGFLTRTMKVQLTAGFRLVAALKLALTSVSSVPPESSPSGVTTIKTATPSGTIKPTPTGSTSSLIDPERPYALIKDTPTGYLNVRVGPAKTATKTAEVKPGEKYSYDKTKSDSANTVWYEIKKDGVVLGWISGQYVENVE